MQKYDISKDEFKKRKFRKDDIDEFKGNITWNEWKFVDVCPGVYNRKKNA
jgi:hypothetical protein